MDKGDVMSDREAFEIIARASGFHDFDVSGNGCYVDDFLQHFYAGWSAATASCSEIPNSSGHVTDAGEMDASRQSLEGEPIGEVGYMIQPNWDDPSKTKGVALVDKSLAPGTKLYTHPASDVPDAEYIRALKDAFDIIQATLTQSRITALCAG